jgi:hypothetical protein
MNRAHSSMDRVHGSMAPSLNQTVHNVMECLDEPVRIIFLHLIMTAHVGFDGSRQPQPIAMA